jgi:hypothetical protein
MSVVRGLASRLFHKLTCWTMPFRRAFEIVDPAKSAKQI